MRAGLAQINPTVGDIDGNARLILDYAEKARSAGCDLVLFPELALTGYPPEDLLLKPAFITDNLAAIKQLARKMTGIVAIVGFVDRKGAQQFNAAAWIENGRVRDIYHKRCLPNYGVFDERRYFTPGNKTVVRSIKGTRVGVTICEDIWIPGDHLAQLKKAKAGLIANISASPFDVDKFVDRKKTFKKTLPKAGGTLLYCNMAGGQDELVFDGGSFMMTPNGAVTAQFPQFKEYLGIVDTNAKAAVKTPNLKSIEQIHQALITGLRDYVQKNGFSKVALGLSGGIDSALVAALASEALGPDNVIGVTMPSKYNLAETRGDAELVAKNLGIAFHEIPIQSVFQDYLKTLAPFFNGTQPNLAEENLQSRVRGTMLMALSNKFGWLILTTGNKSEMSTGYCTLYGDTAGGFAVIKDVLKTTVYALSRLINEKAGRELIPQTTIDRAPTAELRENQKDEDSLGAYSDLDPIVVDYVENNLSVAQQLKKRRGKEDYVRRIVRLIERNEYKRRQAPPGIKITPRSFGRDHRMPITNRSKSL